jgi:cytochrome c553
MSEITVEKAHMTILRALAIQVAILLLASSPARSAEDRLATCLQCHGENGQSQTPGVPSLGGEPAQYALIQLFMYREKLRVAPVMNDIMKQASDDDLRAISDAIAKLPPPPPPSEVGDSQRLARGSNLVEQNHCNVCHRADFSGQENVPRLADQREDYLLKSLQDYKSGARHGYDATMAEVLQPINESDLGTLAYFLAYAR